MWAYVVFNLHEILFSSFGSINVSYIVDKKTLRHFIRILGIIHTGGLKNHLINYVFFLFFHFLDLEHWIAQLSF